MKREQHSGGPVIDPVHYYGLEIKDVHWTSPEQPILLDVKVAAFHPYKLCAQPVIIGPRSTQWNPDGYINGRDHDGPIELHCDKLEDVHECLRVWGIQSITLPSGEYNHNQHGLAWMLGLAQRCICFRRDMKVYAYAVTQHGNHPQRFEGVPEISFKQ